MKWEFSNDAPIYAQLILQIKVGIVSGTFSPGERLAVGAGSGNGSRRQPQHHAAGIDRAGTRWTGVQSADCGQICDGGSKHD